MTIYKIKQFNKRRLARGEKYCYKTDIYEDKIYLGFVWLCKKDIRDIVRDKNCKLLDETI